MRESKLLLSLKTLTKEELEGVRQLLNTDLLLKGSYKQECIRLFEYIMSHYDDLNHPNLDRFITLEEMFKGEGSKINRLEKTMSSLLSVIDYYIVNFLSGQNFSAVRDNMLLSYFYRKKGYNQRVKLLLKKVGDFLTESKETVDAEYYSWLYFSNQENMNINEIFGTAYSSNDYFKLLDNINEYALVKKLEIFSTIIYKYRGFDTEALNVLTKFENEIESNINLKNNQLIQLFYISLLMIKNYDNTNFDKYYNQFSILFEINKYSLSYEIKTLLAYFENTCNIIRYNKENSIKNLEVLHYTQRRLLKEKYLLIENKISSITVTNLVSYSVKLKDYEWVKNFLEEWKDYIGYPLERENIIKLCWGLYYFALEDYEKAEDNIGNKYDDIYHQLLARRLRIRIYYERKEDILLSYEVEAHKVFVHRIYAKKAIDINHYEANNNFVNRLRQIINLRNNPEFNAKERLLKKVTEQKCSEKEWLIDKIEEIKTPPPKKK